MFITGILKNAKKYSSTRTPALGTRIPTRFYHPVLVLDNFKSCVLVLVLEVCALDSSTVCETSQLF